MKLCVVGNVVKDVYLNLNTRTEQFEADRFGVKWLDIGFNASEHHFFNRTSSLGGAAISLEVLEKMGVEASVLGSDIRLEKDGLKIGVPPETYRYILIADGKVSYLVPDGPAETKFNAPLEPVDWIMIDRSANLTKETMAGIIAYLDISSGTQLAIYVQDPSNSDMTELAQRADLVFVEQNGNNWGSTEDENSALYGVSPQKIIKLSETGVEHLDIAIPLALERVDMFTHLSIYSIATATVLGGAIMGRPLEECLRLAVANMENARLDATLPLDEMERIAENIKKQPSKVADMELVAANLVYKGKGILAADESGGSIAKKFAQLNIPDTYEYRRDYRNIFFTTQYLERFVNGVILFDETSKQMADNGQNFVEYLTGRRVIPGIKVDQGLVNFDNSLETYTKGLEGLPERLAEYYARGLRFTKWRAAFEIRTSNGGEIITPTEMAINENCRILAEYALECQNAGLVPIVEPEVVYNGYYSIEQNASATSRILDVLFEKLAEKEVNLKACILKVNMVLAGKAYGVQSTPDEVGEATATVLKEHVPEGLAGVVFLSGGQTPEQATENLAAVEKNGPFPWPVTFSFARALQDPALFAWRGDNNKADEARNAFQERLKANCRALIEVEF